MSSEYARGVYVDLFDASLPELRNVTGTDISVYDQRGRRVYASLKYSM